MMDLTKIKEKFDSLQNKGQSKEKTDFSKIFWKPKQGNHQIRILPSKFDKTNPFREIMYHYGINKFPMLSLTNWGEADPIVEISQKLRKSDEPKNWELAKKITPKRRYSVPVIVRGEEKEDVRLWEFGTEIYKQLMSIALNEDYGDFTDVSEGRDFIVEAIETEVFGRKGIKCTIVPRVKTTQVTTDAALLEKWLEEQPDLLSVYRKYSYDELLEVFKKWTDDEDVETENSPKVETEKPKGSSDKFNDLFGDD